MESAWRERAKIFWSGRSQAVRLPKVFRLKGKEARIHRRGASVILDPIADDWDWLDEIAGALDESFVKATAEQLPAQRRPGLDDLFR